MEELLKQLINKIDLLDKKINILDQNLKKVANSAKVSELISKAQELNISGWSVPKPQIKAVDPKELTKPKAKTTNKTALVKGKMIVLANNNPVPLPDLTVKIYDATNKLIKNTKTDRNGTWMCNLFPNKYIAEFTGKYQGQDLVPQNKTFEVKENDLEVEVR